MRVIAITMTNESATRYDVRRGKRAIGFISLMNVPGRKGWYFIPNKADIAARVPCGVCHPSPDDALAFARTVLGDA